MIFASSTSDLGNNTYWLVRVVYIRWLGIVCLTAFLVSFEQNRGLIGDEGLTPAVLHLSRIRQYWNQNHQNKDLISKISTLPTLFWIISPSSDNIERLSLLGAALSSLLVLFGASNSIIILVLWISYISIVNIGQTWYSFGWESQLLETLFLSIFLVPVLSFDRFPRDLPTPFICISGNRWLLFRIILGAGLIKIRGDSCWRDLTCLNYHYQTQPVPNPLSKYFHQNYSNNIIMFLLYQTIYKQIVCRLDASSGDLRQSRSRAGSAVVHLLSSLVSDIQWNHTNIISNDYHNIRKLFVFKLVDYPTCYLFV